MYNLSLNKISSSENLLMSFQVPGVIIWHLISYFHVTSTQFLSALTWIPFGESYMIPERHFAVSNTLSYCTCFY